MRIVLYPSYIYFNHITEDEETRLNDTFSVLSENYFFSKLYKEGKWDGYKRFYNQNKRTLPIGFLNAIKSKFDITDIEDKRNTRVHYDSDIVMNMVMRDFQSEVIAKALARKSGIIDFAMNAGKTYIFVVLSLMLKRNNVLILTHRKEILKQIVDEFKELDFEIGQIGLGKKELDKQITIGMVQTVANSLSTQKRKDEKGKTKSISPPDPEVEQWFQTINCLIIDEIHHAVSSGYQTILRKSRAYMRFGFSGTVQPEGTIDGYVVRQYIGDIIASIKSKELIDRGISAKPIIKVIHLPSTLVDDYNDSVKQNVIYSEEKILAISKVVDRHPDEKVLVVTDSIPHGTIITKVLQKIGYNCKFASGESPDRTQTLIDFEAGKIPVLMATTIIDEGVNIKDINVVVLAFPRRNYRQTLQRIGRGMRIADGKSSVVVYDFKDTKDKYLYDQFKDRMNYYKDEEFEWGYVRLKHDTKRDEERSEVIAREIMSEISARANDISGDSGWD